MRIFSTLLLLMAFITGQSQTSSPSSFSDVLNNKIKTCGLVNSFKNDSQRLKVATVKTEPVKKDTARIVIRCSATLISSNTPLFIIDGIIASDNLLKYLHPNDIDSVHILKDARAIALYGSRGVNGVIIITTKSYKLRKFIIKDMLDGKPIPGATVSFTAANTKDTITMVANDSGVVVTDKLKYSLQYNITVSSTGYSSVNQVYKNRYQSLPQEILLSRDIKSCGEVVLNVPGARTIRCGYRIRVSKIISPTTSEKQKPVLKLYPNPVAKGSTITVTYPFASEKMYARILNLCGAVLATHIIQQNKQNMQLAIDFRWAAGVYFVQLVYANGQVAASDRVIIQ
jgi:TonB-dependent SusC/RagA subfamily outer membrane receptor